jgi:hypothetical protein
MYVLSGLARRPWLRKEGEVLGVLDMPDLPIYTGPYSLWLYVSTALSAPSRQGGWAFLAHFSNSNTHARHPKPFTGRSKVDEPLEARVLNTIINTSSVPYRYNPQLLTLSKYISFITE